MKFGQNSINMPRGKNNCAMWNYLTPVKIDDEDPICNFLKNIMLPHGTL
jgi:hypothetical protein